MSGERQYRTQKKTSGRKKEQGGTDMFDASEMAKQSQTAGHSGYSNNRALLSLFHSCPHLSITREVFEPVTLQRSSLG